MLQTSSSVTKYFVTDGDVRNIETCLEIKKCRNFLKDNDLLSAVLNLSCSFRDYFSFILGLGRIEPIAIHLTSQLQLQCCHERAIINMPFLSSPQPLFQSEAKCEVLVMKISFHSYSNWN